MSIWKIKKRKQLFVQKYVKNSTLNKRTNKHNHAMTFSIAWRWSLFKLFSDQIYDIAGSWLSIDPLSNLGGYRDMEERRIMKRVKKNIRNSIIVTTGNLKKDESDKSPQDPQSFSWCQWYVRFVWKAAWDWTLKNRKIMMNQYRDSPCK